MESEKKWQFNDHKDKSVAIRSRSLSINHIEAGELQPGKDIAVCLRGKQKTRSSLMGLSWEATLCECEKFTWDAESPPLLRHGNVYKL